MSVTAVAARTLKVELREIEVRGSSDLDTAFDKIQPERIDAVLVPLFPMFFVHRARIVDLVAKSKVPAMYDVREYADQGGLVAYGPVFADLFRRAAVYVDKILKGAKPRDLPVEQPMTFEFVVNMKTARELGITFPNEIMLQVTEVIE